MAYSMNDVCENKTHSLGIVTATTTSSQTITRLRVLLIIIIHNKHTRSPSHVFPLYWVKVTRRRILFHCQGIECPLKNWFDLIPQRRSNERTWSSSLSFEWEYSYRERVRERVSAKWKEIPQNKNNNNKITSTEDSLWLLSPSNQGNSRVENPLYTEQVSLLLLFTHTDVDSSA